jgi:hypothetical protein
MLPISLPSKVIGSESEMGSAVNGVSGLLFDVEPLVVFGGTVAMLEARGVEVALETFGVTAAGAGAGVTFGVVGAVATGALGVGVATLGVDDAAPAGM